jgi:endonuclease/exonuclease/phosphatase family metal-dependent hydrolase
MAWFAPPSRTEAVSVRVMTYNVHRCLGLDRSWSPARIAEVIASCHPDIVGLQELDVGRARSGHVDQAEVIARDLGMDVHFFPCLKVMEEQYGDAILTRWPARLVKAGPLPGIRGMLGVEPRGALWSAVSIDGVEVQVFNTHFGLLGRERTRQAQALLGHDWLGHPDCADPVVLLGDLNSTPRTRAYRRIAARLTDVQRAPGLQRGFGRRRTQRTFPTRFPTLRLDHIFVSSSIEVLDVSTIRTPLARLASDHLPLVAELCIRPAHHHRKSTERHHHETEMRPADV